MSNWKKMDDVPGVYTDESGRYRVIATGISLDERRLQRVATLPEGSTLAQATARRQALKEEIENEGSETVEVTVSVKSITLFAAQWVAEMISENRWGHRTARSNRQNLRIHILPVIGHIDVDDLQRDDVRDWIEYAQGSRLNDGRRYGHRSLQRWWRVLKHLVKAMYLEGHVDRRFVEWVRDQPGPQGDKKLRRESATLTHSELLRFVEAAKEDSGGYYAEIVTLAFTGMRAGEIYGLDWHHIDFSEMSITLEQSYSKGRLGPIKTGVPRVVPMLPQVAEAIQEHRVKLMRDQNLGLHAGIAFPSTTGKRRTLRGLHTAMQRIAESCGIDVKVGPQVLRSTFVTLLRQMGAGEDQVKGIVGHMSDDSKEHYTRPRVEDLQRSAALILEKKLG